MNRRSFFAAASMAVASGVATMVTVPQRSDGELRINRPLWSDVLNTETRYTVFLPSQRPSDDPVPILYLLHGILDDNTSWVDIADIKRVLDELITSGRIPPSVVVMPDERRDTNAPTEEQPCTYYMNDADGEFRWEDMFFQELMPRLETKYNAGGSPGLRGICGYSMGGFGTILYGTAHPGVFAGAAGLSVSQRTAEQIVNMDMAQYNQMFGHAWGIDLVGEERRNERYHHYNLPEIIQRSARADLLGTAYYLDIGTEDTVRIPGNDAIRNAFTEQDVPYEFHTEPGAHDWNYWRPALVRGLEFLAGHMAAPTT